MLSCGRDVTSPGAAIRFARGIAWKTEFPPAYQLAGSGSSVVDFNRVRVVLHHSDGSIALDTLIDFPAGVDEETVSLDVKLLPSAPSSGEPLSLNLAYINAAGDTVFKGGPVGVTATPSAPGAPPPAPVTIPVSYTGPGASAVAVQIAPRSASVQSGGSYTFSAVAVDGAGAPVPNTPIIWNSLDPSIATVPSAAVGTAVAANTRGNARIQAQLLTGPSDVVTLTVLPRPTTIAAQSGSGQSGLAGAQLTNPLVALVTASDGLGVGGVTVTFAVASGGGSVASATVVTDNAGLAQTTWRLGATAGSQSVTATAGTLTGSPVTFTATARSTTPAKLAVGSQPANAAAGASIGTVTVVAQTVAGDTATSFTGAVSLALSGGTSGATLGGTATVNAVGGVATFSGLTVSKAGTGYTLAASSSGLTGATTSAFDITAAPASKLQFTVDPLSSIVGNPVGTPTVTAMDAFGNVVTGFTGAVSIALATNPGAATLSGTTTANAVAGVASFSSLSLNRPGTGYTLSASATGLASATSSPFDVAVGPAAAIVLSSGGGQTGNVGAALASPVVVQVQDAFGNGVAGTTVNFAVVSGGGSVSASGVSNTFGNVSINWTLGATVGAQQISATATGLAGSPLLIGATGTSALNHFVVTTQPATTDTAGMNVLSGFVVSARDASNALIPTFTGAVTLGIGTNPGGATLSGTTSVNAVSGVATFNAFKLDKAGTGYTVVASATGFTSVTSSAFNIVAGSATTMAISAGNAQTGPVNALLPTALSVLVTDANGNPVAGRTITWAVASGGGSLDSVTSVTNASGIGSRKWTLGATAGAQSVTATSTGLSGSPLTFTATASGGVASTTVTPHLDTLTSINDTFTLPAQAKDGAGGNVAGTFTFVSRNPAVATVGSTTGVVTAVTNGSTYVVATEAGGTKDSALFVVHQQLATINVSPGSRNIYLTGGATFTASAVDGRGNALSVQPTFTWSSTAPAVATVNSSTGVVATLTLGTTQIRATSGTVTGVSNVNVITPITRIVVAIDTAGANANDVATLPSLGLHRAYKAIAHDTLDAVMSGVTFAWTSSNGSVALLDTVAATRAVALTAANGTTAIQATAQGVTGAASLTVSQVLASISLTPASATIAITGTQPLLARGLDANGRFISTAIAFTYASSATGVATVSSSGVVTGVALGSANMTASSGAVTSNNAVMTVANTGVPAVISFGRDTLSVGRGSSASIPVFLSKPNATALTVNLAVADTFAFWSTATISIPANSTSGNATLNGHNAGTTTVIASDGSGAGYAPDTAVLAVQATLRLTSGGYGMNATDQVSTQVLMSDPSPAGGTYVTFNFGTAGTASVSPNPAYIPAGQLAADIQILGVAGGSTTITPSAIGVNGTASSVTVYNPVLNTSAFGQRLGAGQYESGNYIYLPTYNTLAVPITMTSSDTTVAKVTPSLTIPAGGNYAYYTISAVNPGSATITYSAPGWTAAGTIAVTTTTPYVGLCCGTTLNTTSPAQGFTVYAEDSVRSGHYRTSSLVVRLSSSDTNVLKVIDSVVTIAPGQYYNGTGRVIPGGSGGTAYLRATASGHRPDSTSYTVVGPKLEFSWVANRLGLGQEDDYQYVYAPNNVATPLVVTLTADTTITGLPATVTIPAGTNYVYFNVRGKALGTVPIIASAAGYQGDTATYVVTTPRLTHSGGGTLVNFQGTTSFYVYATDSVGTGHYRTTPLTITLRSTDTTVIKTDTLSTIIAGQYYTTNPPQVTVIGTGSAQIIVTAPGHTPDTLSYSVTVPKLNFSFVSAIIGKGQNFGANAFYVYTPNGRAVSVPVTLTQKHATVDTLSSSTVTIAANNNYQYFGMYAVAQGTDTLIASAAGYQPDTAFLTVSSPRLSSSGLPGSVTTTNPPFNVTVYATDTVGSGHYVNTDLVVKALTSDSSVIRPAQQYFHIVAGQYYAQPSFNVIGPGTASVTFSDSAGTGYSPTTTNSMTITGPSLGLSAGTPVLGMRQNSGPSGWYVYTPNAVATPLTVNLVSTGTRVATVPASVVVPAGNNYAYFQVTAQDTLGTIQIQATATGYNGASSNVQVTAPKFVASTGTPLNTTSSPSTLTIFATDANGTAHYVNENVPVTLASSAPGVATIDSAAVGVTILAGTYYTQGAHWAPVAVGTSQLSMSDSRAAFYKYGTATVNVSVITPTLNFSFANTPLGIGQYLDNVYAYTPDNMPAPATVSFSHLGTAHASTLVSGAPVSSVTIPAGTNYSYFRLVGVSAGIDSLVGTLSSPLHNPAITATTVGQGRIDPIGGWPSSVNAGDSVQVTLYARDPATNARYVAAATTFTLAPNSHIQFVSGGVSSTVITSVTIPADQYYVQFWLKGVSTGSGSATITATNYVTYSNTVTVP